MPSRFCHIPPQHCEFAPQAYDDDDPPFIPDLMRLQ